MRFLKEILTSLPFLQAGHLLDSFSRLHEFVKSWCRYNNRVAHWATLLDLTKITPRGALAVRPLRLSRAEDEGGDSRSCNHRPRLLVDGLEHRRE